MKATYLGQPFTVIKIEGDAAHITSSGNDRMIVKASDLQMEIAAPPKEPDVRQPEPPPQEPVDRKPTPKEKATTK